MRRAKFALLPLSVFVAMNVHAEKTEQLDVINVVTENTGAKSKTNVVTLADLKQSASVPLMPAC